MRTPRLHGAPLLMMLVWPVTTTPLAPMADPVFVVELARPTAPQMPPPEELSGPQQVHSKPPRPRLLRDIPPRSPDAPPRIVPAAPSEPVRQDREPAPQTAAPPARPAPPALPPAAEQPTWGGRVLGALDKQKRFPREAQARRLQGVPYIRFVIDRQGKVLSSILERSSGHRALDAEAVALRRRAQPLPKPPDEVPGATVELVAPVEFFLK